MRSKSVWLVGKTVSILFHREQPLLQTINRQQDEELKNRPVGNSPMKPTTTSKAFVILSVVIRASRNLVAYKGAPYRVLLVVIGPGPFRTHASMVRDLDLFADHPVGKNGVNDLGIDVFGSFHFVL